MPYSANVGAQIAEIVRLCDDEAWKVVNYAKLINQMDALSRDILYHKSCITEHWRTCQLKSAGLGSAQKDNDTLDFLAAEIQFYS